MANSTGNTCGRQLAFGPNDCYNGPYESYKTSATPVSDLLNDTFEQLHYGLSLNNHDDLFPL